LVPYVRQLIELPPWFTTALFTILIGGFPVAMYFAWNYERSPEGFVRTTSRESWQNPLKAGQRKPLTGNFIIVGLLVVIVFMYLYPRFLQDRSDVTVDDPSEGNKVSIAVLPFRNMSGDPEMEPFCDGMTDAMISRLTKIDGIGKVISSTTMMGYKETQKPMPKIAVELGVTHILESGFQKSGSQIRINLQLIDGPSDDHFWSDVFVGQWGNIFKIQAEVAELVARNLNAEITQDELTEIQQSPTDNVEAYEYYLKAWNIHFFQYVYIYGEEDFRRSRTLYEKAIELDPEFALAYAGLADLYDANRNSNIANFPQAYDSLRHALSKKAFSLNPNSSFVNNVRSWMFLNAAPEKVNLDSGFYFLNRALELDPKDALNYWSLGGFFSVF